MHRRGLALRAQQHLAQRAVQIRRAVFELDVLRHAREVRQRGIEVKTLRQRASQLARRRHPAAADVPCTVGFRLVHAGAEDGNQQAVLEVLDDVVEMPFVGDVAVGRDRHGAGRLGGFLRDRRALARAAPRGRELLHVAEQVFDVTVPRRMPETEGLARIMT